MKKTKKQHTVPQCYLRNFADSSGRLFAYDKKSDQVYVTKVRDAAQEAFFYDFPPEAFPGHEIDVQVVEKFLSRLEADYSPCLADLIASAETGSFSHKQISEFAPYVVLQWKRTRTYRDTAYELISKVSQDMVDTLVEANFPEEKGKVRITMEKENMAVLHAQELLDESKIAKLARVLELHFWVIGINHTGRLFYTSDHPVVRRANIAGDGMVGADKPGVEFVFPLSSNHILLILERSHFASMRKYDSHSVVLTAEQVDDYNRLQVMRSAQRLYCRTKDFELAKGTCTDSPMVRDPDRSRIKVESTPIIDMKNYTFTTALE
ncbi:MAG: DUF4238 domain-containing protein [Thermoguttaceae bacterium]